MRYLVVREMGRDFGISCSTICSTEKESRETVSRVKQFFNKLKNENIAFNNRILKELNNLINVKN